MNKTFLKAAVIALATTAMPPLANAADNVDFTLVKQAPRSNLQVAIVPFAGAESISGIVTNDLTNLGQFTLDSNLPERPHSSSEVTLPVATLITSKLISTLPRLLRVLPTTK